MFRPVNLNTTVKPGQRVPPEDLGQVRFALSRLGLFDPARDSGGEESLMGGGLRRALGTFQAGQGLREDSTLRPGGPTEQRLNLLLERNKGLRVTDQDNALTLQRERTPGALAGRVGPGLENHPDDVAAVSTVLRQLGVLKPGTPNPTKTGPVFGGLMSFQRQNGLARDATVAPDGPTEQLLVQQLSARAPGTQGTGAPTPLINATEASFRNGPADPIPVAQPTDQQRPGFVHPLGRLSQQRRRQAEEVAGNPQLSAERREAQRQDARRMLDRIIQLDRGEPLDTSSDDVGTARRLREFVEADPEEQARRRDRLRQLEAPSPPPAPTEFERRIARVLDGIRPVDGGNPSNPSVTEPGEEDADAEFLINQFAGLQREADQQTEQDQEQKTLREKLATTGRVHNLVAGSDRRGLQRFHDLYRNTIDGTGKDIAALNKELDQVLSAARDLDNGLVRPFLVSSIIQNLIDLDPEGLGPELGFVAQAVNSNLNGPSPGFEAASPLAPGARLGGIRL